MDAKGDAPDENLEDDELVKLEIELQNTILELELTKKQLAEALELQKKSDKYNADLRLEIEKLNCLLKLFENTNLSAADKVDVETQVNETLLAEEYSDYKNLAPWSKTNEEHCKDSEEEGEVKDEPTTIAESLKEAAESAMQQSGFVYDENTGLYYDHKSGYYYDSEKQLYYEPNHGTYYYFDSESGNYQFHSQVDLSQYNYQNNCQQQNEPPEESITKEKKKHKRNKRKASSSSVTNEVEDVHGTNEKKAKRDKHSKRKELKNRNSEKEIKKRKKQVIKEVKTYCAQPTKISKDLKARLVIFTTKTEEIENVSDIIPTESAFPDSEYEKQPVEDYYMGENAADAYEREGTHENIEMYDTQQSIKSTGISSPDKMVSENMNSIGPDMSAYYEFIQKQKEMFSGRENIEDSCTSETDYKNTNFENCDTSNVIDNTEENEPIHPRDKSKQCRNTTDTDSVLQDTSLVTELFPKNAFSDDCSENISKTEVASTDNCDNSNIDNEVFHTGNEKLKCHSSEYQTSNDVTNIKQIRSVDDRDASHAMENEGKIMEINVMEDEVDLEDGEISDSENEEQTTQQEDDNNNVSDASSGEVSSSSCDSSSESEYSDEEMILADEAGAATHWPPCIRVMVKESDCLTSGSLFILTCSGATIGRDSNLGHSIVIPEEKVSKMHCSITYNEEMKKYMIKDHASQNGTFLNSQRLCKAKQMSEFYSLEHMDSLSIGGSEFDLHIHPGTETCSSCEPGQVLANKVATTSDVVILSSKEKEKLRKKELKLIKKKYGLENMNYTQDGITKNTKYTDKASVRRKTVGSDNPYQKDDLPSSVHVAISAENKGHKLLSKMGWKEGESLGKTIEGITEPIQAELRLCQSAGLGSTMGMVSSLDSVHNRKKNENWLRAKQRFDDTNRKTDSTATTNEPNKVPETVLPSKKSEKPSLAWVKGETIKPE